MKTLKVFSDLKYDVNLLLMKLSNILKEYSIDVFESEHDLSEIQNKLNSATFKVLIIGEFSNGKSTFLNAILKDKILPTATTETTATINVIKYGTPEKAVINYWGQKNEKGEEINNGGTQEIQINELNHFTALTSASNEIAQKIRYIDIYYPSKYCENGIELVDTPGLNTTYEFHELSTLEFLPNGHAGIFLLNATAFLSNSESIYLNTFRRYMTKFLFVANRVDEMNLVDDDPLDFYKNEYWPKKLQKVLESNEIPKIYTMNSKLAESGNWKDSGMQEFTQDLESFLASSDKAKEMIRPVINQSLEIINLEISKTNGFMNGLIFSSEVFEEKIKANLPKLEKVKIIRDEINSYIKNRADNITAMYEQFAKDRLTEMRDKIVLDIKNYKGDFEEFKDSLSKSIKSELTQTSMDIEKYVSEEFVKLQKEILRRYNDLYEDIKEIQNDFSSNQTITFDLKSQGTINIISLDNDFIKDLFTTFGVGIGIGALAGMLLTGPIGLFTAFFGNAVFGILMEDKQRQNKLLKISSYVTEELNKISEDILPKGRDIIKQEIKNIIDTLNKLTNKSINNIDQLIIEIRKEKNNSENLIKRKRVKQQEKLQELEQIKSDFLEIKSLIKE